ncbi:MAG TPA: M28 family peptidase [Longimicrobiales bacterium]
MKVKTYVLVALLPVVLAACTSAPAPGTGAAPAPANGAFRSAGAITDADLKYRLYAIAHDSMAGRATGTPGHLKVTEYIASEMRRLGLQPGGENTTYFQSVPMMKRSFTASTLTVDGRPIRLWDDFVPIYPGRTMRSIDNAQVVFGGIAQDTMKMLTREQAAGKIVVLLNRSPNPAARGTTPGSRLEGAVAVLTVNSSNGMNLFRDAYRDPDPVYTGAKLDGDRGIPMVITPELLPVLFGRSVDSTTTIGTLGKAVRGSLSMAETPVTARNVVAILPGADPALRNTYVAIGAHSDHDPVRATALDHDSLRAYNAEVRKKYLQLGRNPNAAERADIKVNVDSLRALRPARRDSIFNGADDDGSGTVAVIEIAEAMATAPEKPKRSVLFVWHAAEELGLIGADHFTTHPTVPRDSIVAQLNIDMIGRGGVGEEPEGGANYLQLIGWRRLSNQLGDVIEAVNNRRAMPFKFDLKYDAAGHPEQFYCRSDHYMYARYGIPVAFFSTGGHGDYHQVTDEPQYIDYTKLLNVAQLIHDIGRAVADLPGRPVVDGPKPDPQGQCRQ